MKQILRWTLGSLFSVLCIAHVDAQEALLPKPPTVIKKGTVAIDRCETSPFVFKGKLYRLEGRVTQGNSKSFGLGIIDHETRKQVGFFAESHFFPSVMVENDTVYVFATVDAGADSRNAIDLFSSKDLQTWTKETIFHGEPKMRPICNTSICKADGRYVLSVESSETGSWGSRFLESKDLKNWTLLPKEYHGGTPGSLYSPHFLRYHDGKFYLFATVHGNGGYVLLLHRSADLKTWEASPFNPVMTFEEQDKVPYNPDFTTEDKEKIASSRNIDNSDVDFTDFKGKVVINYCWGNQVGKEFVSEAEFSGTTGQLLDAWFPDFKRWKGIDITRPLSTFAKNRKTFGSVLSADATLAVSSGTCNPSLVAGSCAAPFAFHTNAEAKPWVSLDLGKKSAISGILIRNRTDGFHERAEGLRLQVSDDGKDWREVWTANKTEPEWEIPLREKKIEARYIRLETRPTNPTSFHLQHVEVWGND